MPTFDNFLTYFGALSLALVFLYGLRNYWITLVFGFIAFCIFYFSYEVKNFEWNIQSMVIPLKDAAIAYIVAFVLAVIIYKILPLKPPPEVAQK